MRQHNRFLHGKRRLRQARAGAQKVRHLIGKPGPAVAAAPDHHPVGAGSEQRLGGIVLGQDVAVDDDRDADRGLHPGMKPQSAVPV